jgi:hypothetical protein
VLEQSPLPEFDEETSTVRMSLGECRSEGSVVGVWCCGWMMILQKSIGGFFVNYCQAPSSVPSPGLNGLTFEIVR